MAIEIRADFFRLARTGVGLLIGALLMCGVAGSEAPPAMTTESQVPIPYDTSWGQVYKILFYDGSVLALDAANGSLYQLSPGAPTWSTLVDGKGEKTPAVFGGGYNAVGMAMDALGTIYIGLRYPTNATLTQTGSVFFRVPYQNGTWNVNSGDGWGSNIVDNINYNPLISEDDLFFVDSALKDGSGTLYWMADSPYDIYSLAVDKGGDTDPTKQYVATSIIDGLIADQGKIAVDVNGNIYFTENRAVLSQTARDPGLYFIPAGVNGISGTGGSAESQVIRIDSAVNIASGVFGGPTLDAAGDVYLSSEQNAQYFETFNGVWMIPNECGGPTKVNASCQPNAAHVSLVAPFGPNQALSIDPRGYLWLPNYQNNSADGSGKLTNAWAIAVLAPGSLNLGASPTVAPGGTPAGPGSTLYVNFNGVTESDGSVQPVTLGNYQFSQPGTGSDFLEAASDPNPPATPPTTPYECIATTQYAVLASCEYWVELSARAPGAISGQLVINGVDNNNNPVSNSVYLSGIGQGAEAAMLDSPAQSAVAAEPQLNTPAQVAADPMGDTYVADPGLNKVLYFAAGSSNATGTPVAGTWSAPTGVAVDGSGDLYIAGSHKVFEIPATNGVPVPANQTVIASGLGVHLNLAVDGVGNVYVADADNAQVVKIVSPASANLVPVFSPATVTVGSGYTSPSAVAVDSSGDVFVADGSNLWEITPWPGNVMSSITTKLSGSVTGLAVDASGSVIVSQSGGILRIPYLTTTTGSGLSINNEGPLDSAIQSPNGVALDQSGNLYVSDMTGGTPNLYEFAVTGAVDFGDALSPLEQVTQEVALFDIGNEPLTVTGGPTFSGAGFDLSYLAPPPALTGGTCDTTGTTPVATAASCTVEVGFTPPAPPPGDNTPITYSGDTMSIPTNAGNVPSGAATASLQGTALAGLESTQTTVGLVPPGSTYPGITTATVTVTPEPSNGIDYSTTPSGTVTLTLTNTVTGATITPPSQQATGDATGTTATFQLSNILSGTYCVTAEYGGNITALFKGSSTPDCSTPAGTTFIVTQATPVITLSEPSGVTPIGNIYYVRDQEHSTTITANVSSTLGVPTGTITFMNGTTALGTPVALDGNGNAVFDPGAKGVADGSYNLTAVFSGDQNFGPVTSPVIAYQVIPPSVLITSNPASLSTPAGTPVGATISLQSLAGYSAADGANISCNMGNMYYAECTFTIPQPIICAPPGSAATPCSGVTTTVLTISSNIPVNLPPSTTAGVREHRSGSSPLIPAGIFGLGLFGLAMRRRAVFSRKLLSGAGLALMLFGVVMGFGGCTNNSYTKQIKVPKYTTAAGTYNVGIQITNVSSGAVQSLPFTIPVTIQ